MNVAEFSDLTLDIGEGIAVLTLDRPELLNAVRAQTLRELLQALAIVADHPDLRCMVVTGRGRAFCTGQDLEELEVDLAELGDDPTDDAIAAKLEPYQALTRALVTMPCPTIAAINGTAVGMGAEIALACDLRIAGRSMRIGFVEAARALFQTNGVMWLLPRIVGHAAALQLVLTGQMIDASDALRIGLVGELADDALEAARARAAQLAANAPISLRLARDLLGRTWELSIDEVMALEVAGMGECLRSSDLVEGTRAFLERRTPNYQGR
jgi:enoyl-CoA hydratase/carnithine racemase